MRENERSHSDMHESRSQTDQKVCAKESKKYKQADKTIGSLDKTVPEVVY